MPRSREQPLLPAAVAGLSSPRSSSRTPGITVPKSILVTDSSLQGAPLRLRNTYDITLVISNDYAVTIVRRLASSLPSLLQALVYM